MNPLITDLLAGRQGVVFDWDGTLADTRDRNHRSLCATLAPYGVAVTSEWYRTHCGLAIHDLIARIPDASGLPVEDIAAASRAHLLHTTNPDTVTAITAAVDLAHHTRQLGVACGIASGAARLLVQAGLDALRLHTLFGAVVTREDVEHGKPAPDLFLEAARRLDVDPVRCLAVEDADDGVTAARAAGMAVVTVVDGNLVIP